jgi:hypothetical protein
MKNKPPRSISPPTFDLRELGGDIVIYERLNEFADRFLTMADEDIGAAFAKIPDYCALYANQKKHPEFDLRATPLERYYLEILSYVILSRQFLGDFNEKRDTVLILPDCLAIRVDKCEKKKTRFGYKCTACHKGCKVNQLTQLAEEYGAGAYFATREFAKQFKRLKRGRYKDLSVIGVACVMMLAGGMRSAEEAGVPSQGVLLNFCGCEHWADEPFPTDTVVERVEELLRGKYGKTG